MTRAITTGWTAIKNPLGTFRGFGVPNLPVKNY